MIHRCVHLLSVFPIKVVAIQKQIGNYPGSDGNHIVNVVGKALIRACLPWQQNNNITCHRPLQRTEKGLEVV